MRPLLFYVLSTVCFLRQSLPIFFFIKITTRKILGNDIASLFCLQYVIFLVILLLVEVTFIILIFAVRSEVSAKHHRYVNNIFIYNKYKDTTRFDVESNISL